MPFWSGSKRCPSPLSFNPADQTHVEFIVAAANLRAQMFGLRGDSDAAKIGAMAAAVNVPPFVPKSGMRIAADDKEAKELASKVIEENEDVASELLKRIPKPDTLVGLKVMEHEFEKDDDTNFHMAFIASCGNLRAINYQVRLTDIYCLASALH